LYLYLESFIRGLMLEESQKGHIMISFSMN
jgi:hypothetical protein